MAGKLTGMKAKHILHAIFAWILSVSLMSGTVFGAGAEPDGQTIDPGEILGNLAQQVQSKAEKIYIPDFEGTVHVEASDGMRSAIADHYYSEDDMSWIESADLFLQGSENETGGVDLEATFYFDGTQLYHLQVSYDREKSVLYLVCPELKEEVLAFPVGDFSADAQTITGKKITPEMIADYITALKELNELVRSISLETLQSEALKYYAVLSKYVQVENGVVTVSAGSLSEEGHTTTWSLRQEDMEEMIPEILTLLSEDAFLQQILQSPFAEHVFRLFVNNDALRFLPEGALWPLAQQALVNASQKKYSWERDASVTLALDRNRIPVQLSASLDQGGMKAELFQINAILDGPDHAFEVKVGPVLAKACGIKTRMTCGLLAQGNLKDDMLRETLSYHWNGATVPLFRIQGLDLLAIRDAWLSGVLTLILSGTEYSCDFYTDEGGLRAMVFSVNGKEWFTLTADLKEVQSTELDMPDLSDAFTVDSRKAFFQYIRDASAIRMFEKLSSAGVPQEYVDMLTDSEAATESSRENTQELDAEN